ncbi:glucosamine-6-phosphate deaminase [Anaerobacillus alkaliphilus]|uniref:Glucosamine-6-phosphate deaminase n=1 Tax=Anaerobacillus alkaliphilus TaxID=1548597 RepID=A0A4Q0VVT4_9BACI|nr:glucosamine-6-phosphate deaminase [Anaerobacillus alkaliphilus]RXJ02549.1 glucosamine-6-phosphate deaminase [Anaerobacillus alkaliphilus]
MKIIQVNSYQDMSQRASQFIINKISNNNALKLGFATGGTPKGTYELLIEDYKQNQTSYQNITSFNLDEYIGLSKDHPNSYHQYMEQILFQHIDIPKANIHLPDGLATDIALECKNYEELIEVNGGIDLQILGIGENGHIGFNEPGTSFDTLTHVVKLAKSTREANARYFSNINEVPTHAITMGIQSILKSKEILLLVSGENKAEAVKRLLTDDVDSNFPASALKKHPRVTIIADKLALSNAMVPC